MWTQNKLFKKYNKPVLITEAFVFFPKLLNKTSFNLTKKRCHQFRHLYALKALQLSCALSDSDLIQPCIVASGKALNIFTLN